MYDVLGSVTLSIIGVRGTRRPYDRDWEEIVVTPLGDLPFCP